MKQIAIQTGKQKTLQLLPTNPPQLIPQNTMPLLFKQQQNLSSMQWMKIMKMLTAMKIEKPLGQQKMTAVKDTGTQSTVLTKA
jgi:hypothetical protein